MLLRAVTHASCKPPRTLPAWRPRQPSSLSDRGTLAAALAQLQRRGPMESRWAARRSHSSKAGLPRGPLRRRVLRRRLSRPAAATSAGSASLTDPESGHGDGRRCRGPYCPQAAPRSSRHVGRAAAGVDGQQQRGRKCRLGDKAAVSLDTQPAGGAGRVPSLAIARIIGRGYGAPGAAWSRASAQAGGAEMTRFQGSWWSAGSRR